MPNGTNGGKVDVVRLVDWALRLVGFLLVPALFAMWAQLSSLRTEIQRLEVQLATVTSMGFTRADGLAVWRALEAKADKSEVPPAWFLDEVRQLEERLRQLERERGGRP